LHKCNCPEYIHSKTWADLKGKTIGVSGTIGGGSMNYAFRDIAYEGLDPQNDYQWVHIPRRRLYSLLWKRVKLMQQ